MTNVDMIEAYVEKARSIGSFVELFSRDTLPDRLRSLVESLAGQLATPKVGGAAAAGSGDVSSSQSGEDGLLVALPANGWPVGLREDVKSALVSWGCRVLTPHRAGGGYGWDRELLSKAPLGVTYCKTFLAETGSLVVPSGPGMGTLATLLPPVHLALSHGEGCRNNLAEHLADLAGVLPSRLTLITGPSRTGDIEASMTKGVHGPREVHHWILVPSGI